MIIIIIKSYTRTYSISFFNNHNQIIFEKN